MLLQGIFPAVTTPFYPDGVVYYKKIEHNIDRYSRTPVAGMVVLGSTGEAVMLSDDERREVLKVTAEVAAPEKVLIAGTGAESVAETLKADRVRRPTEIRRGAGPHPAFLSAADEARSHTEFLPDGRRSLSAAGAAVYGAALYRLRSAARSDCRAGRAR